MFGRRAFSVSGPSASLELVAEHFCVNLTLAETAPSSFFKEASATTHPKRQRFYSE